MGEVTTYPVDEEPFLSAAQYGAHARMLAACRRSSGGGAPKFLITSYTHDRSGMLLELLDRLTCPLRLDGVPEILGFSVESSMCASLVRVGAMAVVVEPVVPRGEDARRLDEAEQEIVAYLQEQLEETQGPPAERLRARRAGFPPVMRLSRGDEMGLYGGRMYREVRFGLHSGGQHRADISRDTAEQCARILKAFTAALKSYETPVAFVHFPHGWRSNAPELSWLRIAYAVEPGIGADLATEVAAWNIASAEGVALSVYEPTRRGLPYPQRYEHLLPPAPTSPTTSPTPPEPANASHVAQTRVSVCIEGMARTGLLADTIAGLDALPASPDRPLALFGCTAGVLYGHTVTSLVVDSNHGLPLWADPGALHRRIDLGDEVAVSVQLPYDDSPVMEETSEAMFWVAWCCGERPGVIVRLVHAVVDRFLAAGATEPNVQYAISRVLAEGETCAGKIKFSGDPKVVEQMGLHEPHDDLARAKMQETLVEAISYALDDWVPPDLEWKKRPIWLTSSEPREEPWATLVVPEGAAEAWR